MLQVHHAHLLLSLLPLHVLPPPPLLRPPRCCRRERTARAPSLVRSGCADAYIRIAPKRRRARTPAGATPSSRPHRLPSCRNSHWQSEQGGTKRCRYRHSRGLGCVLARSSNRIQR
ncbi:unnamed protein product [Prorocentrum cordatum]|uniref:Secreted protein n=1 Tax=Prorocentrum cordatum TaxID=2364126 RepID=A0ABN9S8J1_9DINO|nr:unnamed protein product [Polarella glacialis]